MSDDELKEKIKELEKELKEKDKKLKDNQVMIEFLEIRARPRSLGFYRSRFNA